MNINAINQMMMKRNLKFRANELPQEPQKPMGNSPEGPVSKPQEGMNALANNNIAFQGLKTRQIKQVLSNPSIKGPAKKVLLSTLGASMLASSLVSCQKDPYVIPSREPIHVENNITVNVDMSQLTSLLEYLRASNEKLFDLLNDLIQDLKQGRIDDAAFQEQVIDFMLESREYQNTMIDLMVQNGKTEEEARDYLEQILAEVQNGNITAAEAYEQIMKELGDINVTLKEGLNKLFEYMQNRDEKVFKFMNEWKADYDKNEMSEKEFNMMMYVSIVTNQEVMIKLLVENGMSNEQAKAYLEKIVSQLGKVDENQETIIDMMVQNDKTEKEALAYLEKILAEVQNGNMTAADAYKQIMAELSDINVTLKEGLNKLFEYMFNRDEKVFKFMKEWKADYDKNEMSEKEFNMMMYVSIVTNQKVMIELLVQNGMSNEQAKAYLEKIVSQLGKVDENQETIINIMVQNGKTEKDALAYLEKILAEVQNGNMTAADAYKQIMAELRDINLTLKEGLNKLIEYMQGRDNKLFNMMNDWKTQYDNNEMAEAAYRDKMLALISENKDIMLKVLEEAGMTRAEAKAYLEKIVSQLNDANAKLDAIYEEIKNISGDIAKISDKQTKYHKQYMEMAKDANADREEMMEKLDLANYYLKNLNKKVDEQNKLLENLEGEHGNITIEQLKELWGAESEKWMNFFEAQHNLYFGELAETLGTTNYILALSLDELRALNKKVMEQNEIILSQRNRLDQLLAKIDWNTAETLGVAQEIRDLIAEFEFNCNCTCNGQDDKTDENEGILGDLDNIINGNN